MQPAPCGLAQVCAWTCDTPHWCRRGIAPELARSRAATTETPRRPIGAGGAERSEPVRLGVHHHHTRSLCDESPGQSAPWCCWFFRRRSICKAQADTEPRRLRLLSARNGEPPPLD